MAATRTQVATYLNEEQIKYWEAVKARYKDSTDAEILRQLIIDAGTKVLSGKDKPTDERLSDLEKKVNVEIEDLKRRVQQLENKMP